MSNRRKAAKARGQRRQTRRQGTKELRKRFLIVCEGEETEPNYFQSFRVNVKVHCHVIGTGRNTISLVKTAEKLNKNGDYDQVWIVMDKDQFPVQNFNDALSLAREKDMRVAYSNEAFELWFLLHFNYYNTPISRTTYQERLSKLLGTSYRKNNPQIYALLEERMTTAIQNAERLLEAYGSNHRPANDNPSTTVHQLVRELQKHAK